MLIQNISESDLSEDLDEIEEDYNADINEEYLSNLDLRQKNEWITEVG